MPKKPEERATRRGRPSRAAILPDESFIYRTIYEAILERKLPPGTKLSEDTLGEIFSVSRNKIRKVLLLAAHDNIVTLEPNRGAFVTRPSVQEARDVFAARRVVEAGLMAEIARTISDSQLAELEAFVASERAAHARGDRTAWIRLSVEFHLVMAEMVGNVVLTEFLRSLVSRTALIIALYERVGGIGCNVDDHDQMVQVLRRRDPQAAIAFMDQHLRGAEASVDLETDGRRPVDLRRILGPIAEPALAKSGAERSAPAASS